MRQNRGNLYLVRHAEAENPQAVIYGRLPGFGLSAEGRRKATELAAWLRTQGIHRIYTSPLNRAVETARIIADVCGIASADHVPLEALTEADMGEWEGKSIAEFDVAVKWPHTRGNQNAVEAIEESGSRLVYAISQLALMGRNSVVVSHEDLVAGAMCIITGDELFASRKIPKPGGYLLSVSPVGGLNYLHAIAELMAGGCA